MNSNTGGNVLNEVKRRVNRVMKITGQKFGRLTVLKYIGQSNSNSMFLCKCDCGETKIVSGNHLKTGHTKSCGCYSREINSKVHAIHGLRQDWLYEIWKAMKRRCNNPNTKNYKNYGGRGIKLCDEWSKHPEEFIKWSYKNGYKEGLTIDRIDNDGKYEPSNCRWVTQTEQARNRRNTVYITFKGQRKPLVEWSEILGFNPNVLRIRYNKGDREEKLFRPVEIRKQNRRRRA